jgi:hypothetical protein
MHTSVDRDMAAPADPPAGLARTPGLFACTDMFGLLFDQIAPLVGRSPATARQLASRGRRRVRGASLRAPDADIARQRAVVDAFFAAAHDGRFDALVAILDPDVVVRVDGGTAHPEASMALRGDWLAGQQA